MGRGYWALEQAEAALDFADVLDGFELAFVELLGDAFVEGFQVRV